MMTRLERHFADYADHHRSRWNQATHYLGIPTIALALLGLGSRLAIPAGGGPGLDAGMLLLVALPLVYLRWHRGLAAGVALLLAPLYLLGRVLPVPWLWIGLAAGVGLQYVGHYLFEGRAPAFHRNLVHTLVGPLWVAAALFRRLGLYRGADPGGLP